MKSPLMYLALAISFILLNSCSNTISVPENSKVRLVGKQFLQEVPFYMKDFDGQKKIGIMYRLSDGGLLSQDHEYGISEISTSGLTTLENMEFKFPGDEKLMGCVYNGKVYNVMSCLFDDDSLFYINRSYDIRTGELVGDRIILAVEEEAPGDDEKDYKWPGMLISDDKRKMVFYYFTNDHENKLQLKLFLIKGCSRVEKQYSFDLVNELKTHHHRFAEKGEEFDLYDLEYYMINVKLDDNGDVYVSSYTDVYDKKTLICSRIEGFSSHKSIFSYLPEDIKDDDIKMFTDFHLQISDKKEVYVAYRAIVSNGAISDALFGTSSETFFGLTKFNFKEEKVVYTVFNPNEDKLSINDLLINENDEVVMLCGNVVFSYKGNNVTASYLSDHIIIFGPSGKIVLQEEINEKKATDHGSSFFGLFVDGIELKAGKSHPEMEDGIINLYFISHEPEVGFYRQTINTLTKKVYPPEILLHYTREGAIRSYNYVELDNEILIVAGEDGEGPAIYKLDLKQLKKNE